MSTTHIWKIIPAAALMLVMSVPNAIAGATNREGNTAATPGEKATTTRDATSQKHDRRKGTTQTDQLDTPQNASDVDSSGNNASGSNNSGSTSGGQY